MVLFNFLNSSLFLIKFSETWNSSASSGIGSGDPLTQSYLESCLVFLLELGDRLRIFLLLSLVVLLLGFQGNLVCL